MPHTILAIDDEAHNLKIITGFLQQQNYQVLTAPSAEEGWEILQAQHEAIDCILLDRMMPGMSGIELTEKVKAEPILAPIPIVMQTAAAQKEQVAEGIAAGVYYYLTKPYDAASLVTIVSAAVDDYHMRRSMRQQVRQYQRFLSWVDQCHLTFNTLDDTRELSVWLANLFPDPERVVIGITEMLLNALEHGNLGITYEEKTALNQAGTWEEEVRRRETLPENAEKKVSIGYEKDAHTASLVITDQGKGFDWEKYLHFDPVRVTHSHGRGIALTCLTSFDEVAYMGRGNEVRCTVNL